MLADHNAATDETFDAPPGGAAGDLESGGTPALGKAAGTIRPLSAEEATVQKAKYPSLLNQDKWEVKAALFHRIALTFDMPIDTCFTQIGTLLDPMLYPKSFTQLMKGGGGKGPEESSICYVTCAAAATGTPTLQVIFDLSDPAPLQASGVKVLTLLNTRKKDEDIASSPPKSESDILSFASFSLVPQYKKPKFEEYVYEGAMSQTYPVNLTLAARPTLEAYGRLGELVPEPLRSLHAAEWVWFCPAAAGYEPSTADKAKRIAKMMKLETIMGIVMYPIMKLLIWLICCCAGPGDDEVWEIAVMKTTALALEAADKMAKSDNAFSKGAMKVLPKNNALPSVADASLLIDFVDSYAAKVRRDWAKALFTGWKAHASLMKQNSGPLHAYMRVKLDTIRAQMFKYGPDKALELETTFWLVLRARLLRQTFAMSLKNAKSKYYKSKAAKYAGRALNAVHGALKGLESASDLASSMI